MTQRGGTRSRATSEMSEDRTDMGPPLEEPPGLPPFERIRQRSLARRLSERPLSREEREERKEEKVDTQEGYRRAMSMETDPRLKKEPGRQLRRAISMSTVNTDRPGGLLEIFSHLCNIFGLYEVKPCSAMNSNSIVIPK